MAKRKVKFKIFKISNLITNTEKNKTIYNYYNYRIVDFILLNILSHEKKDRKTYNYKTETVYLLNYNRTLILNIVMVKLLQLDMVKSKRNVDVEDLSLVGLLKLIKVLNIK